MNPTSRTFQLLIAGALALLLGVAAPRAHAAGIENPADRSAVQAVALSMDLVKRLDAVARVMNDMDDAPPLFLRTKADKVPKTLAELVTELRSSPQVVAAVEAQGFTPKTYLLSAMAWTNAWFGWALMQEGDATKSDATPAQLRFVQQNHAALQALQENP